MDIEGRLHLAQYRSHTTMMKPVQTVNPMTNNATTPLVRKPLRALPDFQANRCCISALVFSLMCALVLLLAPGAQAQTTPQTGAQQLVFAGLDAVSNAGQINSVQVNSAGDIYLLVNQGDGVRVIETDPAATTVLATAYIGAKNDVGLAMALDPSGNVYVTGTTDSGSLTATSGAAFRTFTGSQTNSFVAKFSSALGTPLFVTFCGGADMDASSIAATADAVFITGTVYTGYGGSAPITSKGIIQSKPSGSSWNGFVEKFSSSGASLLYATYLGGQNGSTTANTIVADSSDDAYIAGVTTSSGYPTVSALVVNQLVTAATGTNSGFLTKLTPAGDGITFSTFIPGTGVTSLVIDTTNSNLLMAGSISLGQFPVTNVSTPLAPETYQVLVRLTLDGQTVVSSTLLAPGTQSYVAVGASGTAWVDGNLTLPLLPLEPLSTIGNSFAMRINSANMVDQTVRVGGLAAANPSYASAPVNFTSVAIDASGNALFGGAFAPTTSGGLLATQTFDLPLNNAPTMAFPSTVHGAVLPTSACSGSICTGYAAYLSKLTIPASVSTATASLALSVDDSPNLTLRNLGSAQATGLNISVSGFTQTNNCGTTLASGGECNIALTGSVAGSITVSATNATTQTQTLPALASGTTALPVVFSPKELDFGIVSSASGAVKRTITVTNLSTTSQTFPSKLDIGSKITLAYTFAQTATDCTISGSNYLLAPNGSCHITIGLTASNTASNDGAIAQNWLIGTRDVQMTAYGQAAALSLSAAEVDFGTQYAGGLRPARYLYLSNNSTTTFSHSAVTLAATSPFTVTDGCPATLEPLTVCPLKIAYSNATTPSADADTLSLDQGLTALLTGESLPKPSTNGSIANTNLGLSATSLNFANPVVVTGVSGNTQSVTITNTGTTAFSLSLTLTGDFTYTTSCGATLAGNNATCSVFFTFVPSQPGTRQGLLAVTAGSGTTPGYVTLTGVGTGIITPANNGTLNFGGVIAGQPTIQWYKITSPFTSFSVATASTTLGSPYTAVIVEDIGYGHGQPASSSFSTSASGTCLNCWVGVQFAPQAVGAETGTLTLASATGGSPYVLSLTGTGLPLTGLLLTPVTQDFGPVAINSVSTTALFAVTNLVSGGSAITLATPTVTGNFAISTAPSGGAACGGTLAYTASCFIQIDFAPLASGPLTGTLSVTTTSSSNTASAALTGYGEADPGISFSPDALVFNNVPGITSVQQTITLKNTSTYAETIGAPTTATSNFTAASTCGSLATTGASCTITVTFTPATATSVDTLSIPVTATVAGAPVLTTYSIPLTGAYTSEDAGLQIVPSDPEYGPQTTAGMGVTRQFTLNNLTAKAQTLAIDLPRQFVLSGTPCTTLAANSSCNFSVSFLPLDNGDITGTLLATGTPTDGSSATNGIGYVEGYGIGSGSLSVTGSILPGEVVSFGTVPSGQSSAQTLTLTNSSTSATLTIRRITSQWPFLSSTTCGATLAPAANCTVTITYSPIYQVATGSTGYSPTSTDTGTLIIESDAASSPNLIDLTGTATPVTSSSPSNTALVAAITLSQNSLTFGNTMVGNTSASQTVTLTNTGTATLTVSSVETTTSDFTVSNNCAKVLPNATCTLTASFNPQSANAPANGSGQRIASIQISSSSATSLEFISLIGVSSPSSLSLATGSLNFGTVLVGGSASQSLQLTNTGTSSITFGTISALTTLTSAAGDYTVSNGSCPTAGLTLALSSSCSLQITFTPTISGTITGTLSIASSASTTPITASLTGTGIQSHLQITPTNLAFGPLSVNSSSNLSLTLENTGTAPINNVILSISGDYAITTPCGTTTLVAGANCTVTVTFTPTTVGSDNSSLTVTSSDPTSPVSVPLTGTGISSGTFTLSVSSSSSASASVASGSPANYTLTVTPINNFSGTVVFNCTPINAAQYASCSLLPSSVILSGAAQNAVATLNTVTESAANANPAAPRSNGPMNFLCLLFPSLIFIWKARTSRHRAGPVAWTVVSAVALLCSSGCGGNSSASNLRYSPSGSYQYLVTATSVSTGTQITQSVTLYLSVQ
jgi:hypothetical protein